MGSALNRPFHPSFNRRPVAPQTHKHFCPFCFKLHECAEGCADVVLMMCDPCFTGQPVEPPTPADEAWALFGEASN